VFLDGVGLGSGDPQVNPFSAAATPVLHELLGGALTAALPELTTPQLVFRQLDATLGFPGLPQSATGQSSILTGRNAAAVMNGHYGPWPGPTLQRMLGRGNLFQQFRAAGHAALLANAYPPRYLEALARRRLRVNAPAFAVQAAGGVLADLAAYTAGRAVSADLTGAYLNSLDPAAPVHSPAGSGALLARLAGGTDFTFFDFWLSDSTGHRGTFSEAVALVAQLDEFLGGVLRHGQELTILITSDHGNLEDKSVRTHTRARVPLIVAGPEAKRFSGVSSITGIAPVIAELAALPPIGGSAAGEPGES
jgi:hypothetical protein